MAVQCRCQWSCVPRPQCWLPSVGVIGWDHSRGGGLSHASRGFSIRQRERSYVMLLQGCSFTAKRLVYLLPASSPESTAQLPAPIQSQTIYILRSQLRRERAPQALQLQANRIAYLAPQATVAHPKLRFSSPSSSFTSIHLVLALILTLHDACPSCPLPSFLPSYSSTALHRSAPAQWHRTLRAT
jgi:hypothetical protein